MSWRETWRKGFAPKLSVPGLRALRDALKADDARLLQGATCSPPPLQCVRDWRIEAGCGIVLAHWLGDDPECTTEEAEEYFGRVCFEVDQALGEPAACRWFLNWFDETPREEMRQDLLVEVDLAIVERERGCNAHP